MNEFLGWAHTLATTFRFARPWWLLLLAVLPWFWWIAHPGKPALPFRSERETSPSSTTRSPTAGAAPPPTEADVALRGGPPPESIAAPLAAQHRQILT